MNVLLIGGAGYIGSNVAHLLFKSKRFNKIIIFDNLATGSFKSLKKEFLFVRGDCRNETLITKVMKENHVDLVMHFAASTFVGESVDHPIEYYDNNFVGTLRVLSAMHNAGIKKIIFSSTAAVYDSSINTKLSEDMPSKPLNPYGASKRACEQLLFFLAKTNKITYAILRYFNVAGSGGDQNELGIWNQSTHLLIPKINAAILNNQPIKIFGNNFPNTFDGTCERDYVHVVDVALAHLRVIDWMIKFNQSEIFNVARGESVSVLQCIAEAEKRLNKKVKIIFSSPRKGDPWRLIANIDKIKQLLAWKPSKNISDMIISDYIFQKNNLR